MSNDQSPPVRKVIPYKKGGRRQSPFAEMAFQYSGTALDVAIQQREQDGVEELPSEVSADVGPPDGSQQAASPVPQAGSLKELTASANESQPVTADVKQEIISPAPLPIQSSEPAEQRPPVRGMRFVTGRKSKAPDREAANLDLQAFITRWKPFLTETQIGICTYVYANSAAVNEEYCFTSNAKLMAAVSKTERQVKTVLNQLIDWKFLIKGVTVVNAPREKRGTYYKLNLSKS